MELLELAQAAARAAGGMLRTRFAAARTGVGTKSSATDMVTDADRSAESIILGMLLDARPNDGVLAEESGEIEGSSGVRWVVDPLDGTTNFLFRIPHFAVSISSEDGDGALASVVYDVMRDECFSASRGAGAHLAGAHLDAEPIRASAKTDLGDALVATGFSYVASEREASARLLPHVLPRIRDIRRAGAAALDLAWVACGRLDAYFESPMQYWDVAAGYQLVAEAGGRTGELSWRDPPGPGAIAAGSDLFDSLAGVVQAAIDRS